MLLFNFNEFALWGLYACMIHECGHLAAMFFTDITAERIIFYGAGIKIVKADHGMLAPFNKELFVLSSGVLANLAVASFTLPHGGGAGLFGMINCAIAAFNLLPLNSLDGGKLMVLLFYKLCSYERAVMLEKYLQRLNILLSIIIIAAFAACGYKNFTLYLTILYLLLSEACIPLRNQTDLNTGYS